MEKSVYSFLAGTDLSKIKTPLYLYFDQKLVENIGFFSKLMENNIKIFYAMKANNYSPLISELINKGYGFDVASKEEIKYVVNLGAHPEKISFSAPSKKIEDVEYAGSTGIKYFAFDSEEELKKIIKFVKHPILFARISSFSKDAVFNLSSKFGMNESYFNYIIRQASKRNWPIKGISFHIGSQNTSLHAYKHALTHVSTLIDIAKSKGVNIELVNVGGGVPAPYKKNLKHVSFYIDAIIDSINAARKRHQGIQFFAEPGRAICANTMALITRIIDIKPYKKPPLLITDTGVFNGIIEPLEGFEYPIIALKSSNGRRSNRKKFFRVSGFSCEGYDVLSQKVLLDSHIKNNGLLAFLYAGAYTFVYENFHMVDFPPIHRVESEAPLNLESHKIANDPLKNILVHQK